MADDLAVTYAQYWNGYLCTTPRHENGAGVAEQAAVLSRHESFVESFREQGLLRAGNHRSHITNWDRIITKPEAIVAWQQAHPWLRGKWWTTDGEWPT